MFHFHVTRFHSAVCSLVALAAGLQAFVAPPCAADPAGGNKGGNKVAMIRVEAGYKGDFKAGETRKLVLEVERGAFVHMQFASDATAFDVDLERPDATHLRRFLDHGEGRKRAMFVASRNNPVFSIHAHDRGTFSMTILHTISKAQQADHHRTYLSTRIQDLAAQLRRGETSDAFWQGVEKTGTPLAEKQPDGSYVLTFLARGNHPNSKLIGGPTNDNHPFERLADSDVWYRSIPVPDGAFFSYRLALDVPRFDGPERLQRTAVLATAKADPLNHHPWPATASDPYGQKSTFRVGAVPSLLWHEAKGHLKGKLSKHHVTSLALHNSRDVWVYSTAGFDPDNPDSPLLILFDAEQFMAEGKVTTIMDNLVAEKKIPPLAVALVSPINLQVRSAELPDNDAFAAFIAGDVLDLVKRETGLKPKRERTILAGASYGGLGASTIALKFPDQFGNVLSMSGSYWWHKDGWLNKAHLVADKVIAQSLSDIHFFLSAGLFETPRPNGFASTLLPNRHLRDVLRAKGYRVDHREYPTAHDIFAWREILPDGLVALIGF